MNRDEISEVEILMTEKGIHSGRTPATLLLVHNGFLNHTGERVLGLNGGRTEYLIFNGEIAEKRIFLRNTIGQAFMRSGTVVIDLRCEPNSELCRILSLASKEGSYQGIKENGLLAPPKAIPLGCSIIVLVSQKHLHQISRKNFCSLFEVIEHV
jgi:hypothetical protein